MIAKESGVKVGSIIRQDSKDHVGNIAGGYLWEVVSTNDIGVQAIYWDLNTSKPYVGSNPPITAGWTKELNTDIWNLIFA